MMGDKTVVRIMIEIAVAVGVVVMLLLLKEARRRHISFWGLLFDEFLGDWRDKEWLPFAMVTASAAVNWIAQLSPHAKLVLALSFPGLYLACFLAWASVRIVGISTADTPKAYAVQAIYLVAVLAILTYTYLHSVMPSVRGIHWLIPSLSFVEGWALAPVVLRLLRKARYIGTSAERDPSS